MELQQKLVEQEELEKLQAQQKLSMENMNAPALRTSGEDDLEHCVFPNVKKN